MKKIKKTIDVESIPSVPRASRRGRFFYEHGQDRTRIIFWTNAKTGEVSLEDPTGREKAVEEMSFDERRAHDAKQAFMQKNKGNRKQNKGTGGGRGGRRRR